MSNILNYPSSYFTVDPVTIPASVAKTGKIKSKGNIVTGSSGPVTSVFITPSAAGTGYTVSDTLTLDQGSGDATVKVLSVDALGGVTAVELAAEGTSGYVPGDGATVTGGSGNDDCEITILTVTKFASEISIGLDWLFDKNQQECRRIVDVDAGTLYLEKPFTADIAVEIDLAIVPHPTLTFVELHTLTIGDQTPKINGEGTVMSQYSPKTFKRDSRDESKFLDPIVIEKQNAELTANATAL